METFSHSNVEFLELFTGWDDAGRDFWCYIAVNSDRYLEYRNLLIEVADVNLAEFGRILATGPGMLPPAETRQEMAREYGFNHKFEQTLSKYCAETN